MTLLFGLFARPLERAASTAVYLATSPEVAGLSGRLFADGEEVAIGGQARQPRLQERLWEIVDDGPAPQGRRGPRARQGGLRERRGSGR